MPIGDYMGSIYKNPVARVLCSVFGSPDIHTHYRVASVIDFFERTFSPNRQLNVLEVGCGTGTNLFELAKRFQICAEGYDLDGDQIRQAREISRKMFHNRIQFRVADACVLTPTNVYDAILFVDFLEHVPNPTQIVAAMDRCLKPAGVIVISVPTPRYPRVFGREMHERIGHLVDGYTAETLTALLPPTYSRIETQYSTGPVGSLLCAIQCRILKRIPVSQVRWLCAIPLLALRGLDVFTSPSNSATLFAVYRKPAQDAAIAA
jgi:SAM-dependent methyltransferase